MPQTAGQHQARFPLGDSLSRASGTRRQRSLPHSRCRLRVRPRGSHRIAAADRKALAAARHRRRHGRAPQGAGGFLRDARPSRHRPSADVEPASVTRRRVACQEARRRRRQPYQARPAHEGRHQSLLSATRRRPCSFGALRRQRQRRPRARLQRAMDGAATLEPLALWRRGVPGNDLTFGGAARH